MAKQTDLYLWEELLDGNDKALLDIYERYVNELYSYGLKISGNKTLVKDCIQEVFIHLIRNRRKLILGPNIHLYLFKSLRSKILDEIRSVNRKQEILSKNIKLDNDYSQSSEEEIIQREETLIVRRRLQKALNELTEKQREIIYLKYTECLSYDEISIILGIDKTSARTLLYRTLKSIKTIINKTAFVLFIFLMTCTR